MVQAHLQVFPKSATQESLSCMRNAFESLLVLSDRAWPKQLQDGEIFNHKDHGCARP